MGAHIIKKIAKCSALIKIKLEIEKYQSNHYHNIKETAGANARAKSEIKDILKILLTLRPIIYIKSQ